MGEGTGPEVPTAPRVRVILAFSVCKDCGSKPEWSLNGGASYHLKVSSYRVRRGDLGFAWSSSEPAGQPAPERRVKAAM